MHDAEHDKCERCHRWIELGSLQRCEDENRNPHYFCGPCCHEINCETRAICPECGKETSHRRDITNEYLCENPECGTSYFRASEEPDGLDHFGRTREERLRNALGYE